MTTRRMHYPSKLEIGRSPQLRPGQASSQASTCWCDAQALSSARRRRSSRSLAVEGPTASGGAGVLLEELDGVADGLDLLGGIVGDLAAELLLERHHELDRVEAVGAQIVDEAGVLGDLSASTPRCSTTIFFTRSATSLIVFPRVLGCFGSSSIQSFSTSPWPVCGLAS